jgi:hypothetical protein
MAVNLPLEEAQAQLLQVQRAIADLVAGKRHTVLKVGSASFAREYHYSETTLSDLMNYRDELQAIIAALSPTTPAIFAKNTSFNVKVGKRVY